MMLPREIETDYNKSPVVRAVTALLLVIAILATMIRVVTKYIAMGTLKLDDALISTATVIATVQSILVILEGSAGLGRHQGSLPEGKISFILKASLWAYINIVNILTDLAIIVITVQIFKNIQTSRSKKTLVIGVFGSRVLILPAVVCHIYYFNLSVSSPDQTFELWPPTIIIQVIQCMSILTTCVPNLKPFLDSVESGQMHAGDLRQTRSKNSASRSGNATTVSQSRRRCQAAPSFSTNQHSDNLHRQKLYELEDMDTSMDMQRGTVSATAAYEPSGVGWDGQSYTSQTVLVQQTWRIDVERNSAAGSRHNSL
ncbi:hypothetical protein QQS21_000714 [Conoideocrella luteorostrata]|uniref:Rhodopsin domain-containing protein n=1 Tax=Conoideocrella luteorostrata TaxID=1105319 RepID=A0AAJ0FYX8_9HYPO|nr:hypothetical protein QQS21_000714 [Conoideocrella luteorostrata]